MGFFSKKKDENQEPLKPENMVVQGLKPLNYSANIMLAWAKAIEGNKDLQDWLRDNGYRELYAAVQAIYLRDEPRKWLLQNGYAHLFAMIHFAEGNENAGKWLIKNKFDLLYHMGRAIDHENDSWLWLKKKQYRRYFYRCQKYSVYQRQNRGEPQRHSLNTQGSLIFNPFDTTSHGRILFSFQFFTL